MAHEIKLEVYTVRIRHKRDENYLTLSNYDGSKDFKDLALDFISSIQKDIEINEDQKKSIQSIKETIQVQSSTRYISGIIESGEYGVEGKLVNRKTRKVYKKEVDDIDIKPFYFIFYIPKDEKKGFLILQRLGIFGINSIFTSHLEEHFKLENENLMIEFSPFVSKKLADSFIVNGKIKEIILRRYSMPEDVADKLGMRDHFESNLTITLKISAGRNRSINLRDKVKDFISDSNSSMFDIRELRNLGFDGAHQSSVKIKLGNNIRTIDLSETGQIRPYFDVDKDVRKQRSGHPVFESIDDIAKGLIRDIINEIY